MDMAKQFDEMMQEWMQAQQALWERWRTATRMGDTTQAGALWSQLLGNWEAAVQQALATQGDWANLWSDMLSKLDNVPDELAGALHSMSEQTKTANAEWRAAQEKLWQGWFNTARQMTAGFDAGAGSNGGWTAEPQKMATLLQEEMQKSARLWQDSVARVTDMQREWLRRWSGTAEKTS